MRPRKHLDRQIKAAEEKETMFTLGGSDDTPEKEMFAEGARDAASAASLQIAGCWLPGDARQNSSIPTGEPHLAPVTRKTDYPLVPAKRLYVWGACGCRCRFTFLIAGVLSPNPLALFHAHSTGGIFDIVNERAPQASLRGGAWMFFGSRSTWLVGRPAWALVNKE